MFARWAVLALTVSLASCATMAAPEPQSSMQQWADSCEPWDDWNKPAEPYRVHGNTYYVGTCGISALLIVGEKSHFLLDTGTEAGSAVVLKNIRKLGVEPLEIFAVGYSHEHFDHVGGMAKVIEATGAALISSPGAQSVFETGEDDSRDPQYGMHDAMIPVKVEMLIENGESITVDGTEFTAFTTPGHTPGALSWQWRSCDYRGANCQTIVYADSMGPVSRDDYRFTDHPEYVAAYRDSLARVAQLDCDILLTPHPSASQMLKRAKTGSFVGGMSCKQYADNVGRRLDARLAKEAAGE